MGGCDGGGLFGTDTGAHPQDGPGAHTHGSPGLFSNPTPGTHEHSWLNPRGEHAHSDSPFAERGGGHDHGLFGIGCGDHDAHGGAAGGK